MIDYATYQRIQHLHRVELLTVLYVACTRARDRLLVTGTDPASEFLEDLVPVT